MPRCAARWAANPSSRATSEDGSHQLQRDLDVAPCRVGVRADFVRGVDDLLRGGLVDPGDVDIELDGEAEAAVPDRADRHAAGDLRIAGVRSHPASHHRHRALETGGVTEGEELL